MYSSNVVIDCVDVGGAWTNANNLISIKTYYTNGPAVAMRKSIHNPDGTMQLYQYAFGDNIKTNTILTGQPDENETNVVAGAKRIDVIGYAGQPVRRTIIDIATGITNSLEVYSDTDDFNRPTKISYLDGTTYLRQFGCCGIQTETNKEGTVSSHAFDDLGRRYATTKSGITTSREFDAAGNVLRKLREGSDDTVIIQEINGYDTAGARIQQIDALGNITTFTNVVKNNKLISTNIYPDAADSVTDESLT